MTHIKYHESEKSNLWAENRLVKFVVLVLAIAQVITVGFVYKSIKYRTTILVPAQLNEELVLLNGEPSDKYLEKLGRDISSLGFTYTPATARSKFDDLLRYYAPEEYPNAQKIWYGYASKIELTQVTSIFELKQIQVKDHERRLSIIGKQFQYAQDRLVESSAKNYIVSYEIRDSMFVIIAIGEEIIEDIDKAVQKEG